MAKILEALHKDHGELTNLLAGLEKQIEIFEAGCDPDYELITNTLDYISRYPDRFHHPMEDLIYRRLKERAPDGAVLDLDTEHEELAALTRSVSSAINEVLLDTAGPRSWVATVTRNFINSYRRHMGVEERFFLPLAERTLTDEDWRELDAEVSASLDGQMSAGDKKRFRALFDYIESLRELAG